MSNIFDMIINHVILQFILISFFVKSEFMSDNSKNPSDYSSLTYPLINIIETCFAGQRNNLVLAGNLQNSDELLRDLKPVAIVNNVFVERINQYNLQIFVATVGPNLENNLHSLRSSPWWNLFGFFIIFDELLETNMNCTNAEDVLQTAWKMTILHTIFLCNDPKKGAMIYTLNPYSNWAPYPWELIQHSSEFYQNHNWSLFSKIYPANNSINCDSLKFNKILRLDNPGGISALTFHKNVFDFKHKPTEKKEIEWFITEVLENALHTHINYTKVSFLGDFDRNGYPTGCMKNVSEKMFDIAMATRYLKNAKHVTPSSIYHLSGVVMVSQKRGNISMFLQIINFFKLWLFGMIFFLSALTVLTLKLSLKNDIGTSTIDIIRFWLNGSLLYVPKGISSRVFLLNIFIFVLIIQSVFRGVILGFLMHPAEMDEIDTYDDIIRLNHYKIYSDRVFPNYVSDELKARIEVRPFMESCSQLVLNNYESVCITDELYTSNAVTDHNLHVSRQKFNTLYSVFYMREKWPVSQRINDLISKSVESGLIDYVLHEKSLNKTLRQSEYMKTEPDRRPIKQSDFSFAYEILGIGLTIASITFIFEILLHEQ